MVKLKEFYLILLQMTERHSRHGALMNGSEKRYKNQSCFYSISKKVASSDDHLVFLSVGQVTLY